MVNEIIYTPVDMTSSMRPLISDGEATYYLELFAQLEPHVFRSSKPMDLTAHYQSMLASHEVKDTQYLKLAEKLICEEFAVVLDTTSDLIRERLYEVTERKATT